MKTEPFTDKTVLSDFCPLPRALLGAGLPSTALLLYVLLLDRATLSQKNGWLCEGGMVYLRFTVKNLAAALGLTERSVYTGLRALEQAGLLLRSRPVGNRASRLCIFLPVREEENCTAERKKASGSSCGKLHPNESYEQNDPNDALYRTGGESL